MTQPAFVCMHCGAPPAYVLNGYALEEGSGDTVESACREHLAEVVDRLTQTVPGLLGTVIYRLASPLEWHPLPPLEHLADRTRILAGIQVDPADLEAWLRARDIEVAST